MNRASAFILLELFTFRNYKKVDKFTLSNFRHLVCNYISLSYSYDEFISLLTSSCISLDKEVCSLCLSFKRYVKKANNIFEGPSF